MDHFSAGYCTNVHAGATLDEMRANLICQLKRRERLFPGIVGYDETVVPQLINAISFWLFWMALMSIAERRQRSVMHSRRENRFWDIEAIFGCPQTMKDLL